MDTCPEQQNPRSPPDKQAEQNRQFKGIRLRKWGKWVSEVRMPKSRAKIWLGSYDTPEQAARAYDAAVFCLRGPGAQFNFPDCVPDIPRPLSPPKIRVAAARYALHQTPSATNLNDVLREEPPSPVSEMEASGDGHPVSQEQSDYATSDNLFGDYDDNPYSTLERLPSLDPATLDYTFTPAEEEEEYIVVDALDLWSS